MKHHPACPKGAHVHPVDELFRVQGSAVFVDLDTVVLCAERAVAHRIAQLINRHGLADIPDHVPDEMTWMPPRAQDRIVDWRLHEPSPTQEF
jgi:hypothetical protein